MKGMKCLCLLLMLGAAGSPRAYTGSQLRDDCADLGGNGELVCVAYVRGVLDTASAQLVSRMHAVCVPPEGTSVRAVRIVADYLEAHPASTHWPASVLVLNALVGAWGCEERDRVEHLQFVLGHLGLYAGQPDGIVGPQTAGAIGEVERAHGLAETGEYSWDVHYAAMGMYQKGLR